LVLGANVAKSRPLGPVIVAHGRMPLVRPGSTVLPVPPPPLLIEPAKLICVFDEPRSAPVPAKLIVLAPPRLQPVMLMIAPCDSIVSLRFAASVTGPIVSVVPVALPMTLNLPPERLIGATSERR